MHTEPLPTFENNLATLIWALFQLGGYFSFPIVVVDSKKTRLEVGAALPT